MHSFRFTCELLADVVINSSSATEGPSSSLDYIPGSCFLGIVARSYADFKNNGLAVEVFHNGKVRFGDAHPLIDGSRAIRVPTAWYIPKGDSLEGSSPYIWHAIPADTHRQLAEQGTQLVQQRGGWVSPDGSILTRPNKVNVLKSAYDADRRRSATSQIFSYEALERGSRWEFSVHIADDIVDRVGDQVCNALVGARSVGRSRSAEFGSCWIERQDDPGSEEVAEKPSWQNGLNAVYAESRLAFLDEYGMPTVVPTTSQLGCPPGGTIRWELSQVRTYRYSPWNGKRRARDPERLCIEKGSVFVVDLAQDSSPGSSDGNGAVGMYIAEGFGVLRTNPEFLEADDSGRLRSVLRRSDGEPVLIGRPEGELDDMMTGWLDGRANERDMEREVHRTVEDFARTHEDLYRSVSASQWGLVRSLATSRTGYDDLREALFDKDKRGALVTGIARRQWERKIDPLKKTLEHWKNEHKKRTGTEEADRSTLLFARRLAARMQSIASAERQAGNT